MLDKVRECDNNFNEAMFITRVDHIFIMVLDSIMENDMNKVKHYISDEIYNKFDDMVSKYKRDNVIRIFDEMNVKSTDIINADVMDDRINITVNITSRYMDYFIDEDGNYVSGINDHRIEKNHRIIFTKLLNAKELQEIRRCPSCGHSLDINASGVCPFCKQIINMSDYDYIITSMELI